MSKLIHLLTLLICTTAAVAPLQNCTPVPIEGGDDPSSKANVTSTRQSPSVIGVEMPDKYYQNGRLHQLNVNGRKAFLIAPRGPVDSQRRWLWVQKIWHAVPRVLDDQASEAERTETVGHHFYVEAALAKGFHVAGVDMKVTLGSPAGVEVCRQLYDLLIEEYDLNRRARLFGQCNTGLTQYNFAATYPDRVDRIMCLFPVTDMRTWPGLDAVAASKFIANPELGYDLSREELEARLSEFNPIDRLKPLADAGVKLYHIHGELDTVAPYEPNSAELKRRYEALGGDVTIELIKGQDHNTGPWYYRSEKVLEFILE